MGYAVGASAVTSKMKPGLHHVFDSHSTSPQGKAQTLMLIDRLFVWPYKILRFIFAHTTKNQSLDSSHVLIIKLMGLGSITKFASLCEKHRVNKEKIKLITFEPNRELCVLLGFKDTFFIRTSGLFHFFSDCFSLFHQVRANQPSHIVDYERCSNAVGTLHLALGWITKAQIFCFENITDDHSCGRLLACRIQGLSLEAMFEKGIAIMPRASQLENRIQVQSLSQKIFININVSSYLLARRYPIPHFLELIKLLHAEYPEVEFHFTGSAKENLYVEEIVKELVQENIPAHNAAGSLTLAQLCQELTTCKLFITCDSGPLHLSAYMGVLTLAIWGPTQFRHFGYDHLPHIQNGSLELSCSPCFLHPYSKPAKACHGEITCLKNLTPSILFKKASILLNEKSITRSVRLPVGMKKEITFLLENQLA